MKYYVVTFTGPFGFIKPWTAVRDGETFSQQFLTPSIIEGMRQRLGVDAILRHRLTYAGLNQQQEMVQSAGYEIKKPAGHKQKIAFRNMSILKRNVMLSPYLSLAFEKAEDAEVAFQQHLCLCRNEDLIFPVNIELLNEAEFDQLPGFELRFGKDQLGAFIVGYNRYEDYSPMYGHLEVTSPGIYKPEL